MSLFSKFKSNLQKTSNFLSSNILSSFQNKKVDRETLEELEAVLISADISLDVVEKLINSVRKVKISDQDITKTVLETLSKEIENILQPREGKILEERMIGFIEGDYDILVSTTIVENGVDVPNANTILINNANHFGLSDLHQMRGRVGRSNKKAFCYLISPPYHQLSDDIYLRWRNSIRSCSKSVSER